MSGLGKHFQISHSQGRIGQGLRKHGPGVGAHGGPQLFQAGSGRDKRGLNAHLLHGLVEQVEGAPVNSAGADHMEPGRADVQHGHQVGRLAGRGEHGAHAPLQGGDFLFHHIQGGVGQAGVEKAAFLQIEESAHLFGALIGICGALHNRGHPGLPVAGLIARMDTKSIGFQFLHTLSFLSLQYVAAPQSPGASIRLRTCRPEKAAATGHAFLQRCLQPDFLLERQTSGNSLLF